MSSDALREPQTFPPKMSFLIIWVITFLFGVFGMIVAETWSSIFWVWTVVALISFRQIWVMNWVQVDDLGIRVRNFAQRGKELDWSGVADLDEQEVPVRKGNPFVIIKLRGVSSHHPDRETTIAIDSDTVGFDLLREFVQAKVRESQGSGPNMLERDPAEL